jgi:glucose/arabinose dehydrogenase
MNCDNRISDIIIKISESAEIPYDINTVAGNLKIPWAIDISEEGNIYFTERPGTIRMIDNGKLIQQPLIEFQSPFTSQGEGGLMGIALDPDFSQNHYIYVMHSYTDNNQLYNRVVRLVEQDHQAFIDKVLLDRIPGGRIHNGGRLKIGPDHKLYITTGDSGIPLLAQDITSNAGKILRINLDGSIPEDNPFYQSPVYSLGHRDPQGITWNEQNILYESEHGQTAHDEINIIYPGENYGWPLVQGDEDIKEMKLQKPLIHSQNETWAPSGIAWISQGPWKGKLLVAALRGERLISITLNEAGTGVEQLETWFKGEYGRLREVVQAKDGTIYLTTSNMDGRGNPDQTDDKILKLTPKAETGEDLQ